MSKLLQSIRSSSQDMKQVRVLAGAAMLLALSVIIDTFTIRVSDALRIGFSFLPLALTGYLYGPVVGAISGLAGDLIKYFLYSYGEPYFPGFAFNALLSGFLYGIILYRYRVTVFRTICAKVSTAVIINIVLTPLWLSIMYGKAFWFYLALRIGSNLIKLPIDTIMLLFLLKLMERIKVRVKIV